MKDFEKRIADLEGQVQSQQKTIKIHEYSLFFTSLALLIHLFKIVFLT